MGFIPTTTSQPGQVLSPACFHAESSLFERVCRIANGALFCGAAYWAFAWATGGTGALVYISAGCALLTARKCLQIGLGFLVYPAALGTVLVKANIHFDKDLQLYMKYYLEHQNKKISQVASKNQRVKVQKITFVKGGTSYDGFSVSLPGITKWCLRGLGNNDFFECFPHDVEELDDLSTGYNLLFINGPAVMQSGGWPTRYQMGAAFEAGLQYLEKIEKASHILLNGHSLGAGMLSEAVLQHDWSRNYKVKYAFVSDRSFSRLSTAAEVIVGNAFSRISPVLGDVMRVFAQALFFISGLELDGVAAAKKLEALKIPHVICDYPGGDGVIPREAHASSSLPEDQIESVVWASVEQPEDRLTLDFHNGRLTAEVRQKIRQQLGPEFF